MSEDPWGDLAVVARIRRERTRAPRSAGLTMVIDSGLGMTETRDVLEIAGDYIDHWKLSFGTSVFVPPPLLRKKIELIRERGLTVFPGGTLFEAAIMQQHCRVYMRRARELGFNAVEISNGTIRLPPSRRRRVIDCAFDGGLEPITEVGKKDPADQPPPTQLADEALKDLEWGAKHVIIEGRESGRGVGVFSASGEVDSSSVDAIADRMGDQVDRLIWEAPLKPQQAVLIHRFGLNVSLGNINPRQVMALEALRSGLRFETLKPIADKMERDGIWAPEVPEPD